MTGSTVVDAVIVLAAIAAMFTGWRQGGSSALLSLIGVLLGGWGALELLPHALDLVDGASARFFVAILVVAGGVVAGYGLGSWAGLKLRDGIRTRNLLRVDSAVGAVVQIVTTLLIIWMVVVPMTANNSGDLGTSVRGSKILRGVSNIAPEWLQALPNRAATLFTDSGFPAVTDPFDDVPVVEVEEPDSELEASPVVAATRASVVRVVGQAEQCSKLLQGSGFMVSDDMIMTNAHVVAGTDLVGIETVNGEFEAEVVYYNPQADIALLRVSADTGLTPLTWASEVAEPNDDAIVMGYPLGGPFQATPARVRDLLTVSGPDIYADTRVDREAYTLRGTVVQGNSGGPVLNAAGEVIGVVFGAAVGDSETGYALSKAEVLKHVGDLASFDAVYVDAVGTQSCVAG
ncbi:MarP family serine protease [Corynebacterium terpenotabidum]|uniref:Serine protease n=1 Tax=Corynebacterium terpenotabidum Y-11 TaxID=1200352 RepID=S4XM63_9CORY|nr:MarP family serine protease [Corynebacterium terpenotabidum]AGP31733.1 membrane-associated serine protease [Corynebacterium terpenotabidum Y-11]